MLPNVKQKKKTTDLFNLSDDNDDELVIRLH